MIRYLVYEKWLRAGERSEFRRSYEHGTEAASLQDAIEQFDAECKRPEGATVIERDARTLGDLANR